MLTLPFLLWINYTSLSVLCLKQSSKENVIPDALYVQQDANQVFCLDSLVFPPCGPLQSSSISCQDKSPLSLSLHLCDSSQKISKSEMQKTLLQTEYNIGAVCSCAYLSAYLLNTEYTVYQIRSHPGKENACQLFKNEN